MKKLIWKVRYAIEIKKFLGLGFMFHFEAAESQIKWLGDKYLEISPVQAAKNEYCQINYS